MRISPDFPGVVYQYRVCVKNSIFGCIKEEVRVDSYDLRDEQQRKELIAHGFVVVVQEQ